MAWEKGVAQKVMVTFSAAGVPTAPTGALTATISKDGGAFGGLAGTVAQVAGTPCALVSLAAADTNCDAGVIKIVDAGGTADDCYEAFVTETEGGSGAHTVTVTVQTAGGTVFEGVRVVADNQTETGSQLVQYTNTSGQVTFYLDAGAWRCIAAGSAAQSGGATNVTVDGAESVTITVTAATVPAATGAANYLLYGYARQVEADAAFGASGVTVKVVGVENTGQVDATANATRHIMGSSYVTDAAGLWSFEIAQALAGYKLRLQFAWTNADSEAVEEEWEAEVLASAADANDAIAWADLAPTKKL